MLNCKLHCNIKLNAASAKGNERKDFLSEIEMMKKVAEGQNPHVVGFLGCVTIQEPLCLITEFVQYGDLLSFLRSIRRQVVIYALYKYNDYCMKYIIIFTVDQYQL